MMSNNNLDQFNVWIPRSSDEFPYKISTPEHNSELTRTAVKWCEHTVGMSDDDWILEFSMEDHHSLVWGFRDQSLATEFKLRFG